MAVERGELLFCSIHRRFLIVDDFYETYLFLCERKLLPCRPCKWEDFYCLECSNGNCRCCFCNDDPGQVYEISLIYFCDKHENYFIINKCPITDYKHLKKCPNVGCKNYYCLECWPEENTCVDCIVASQLAN